MSDTLFTTLSILWITQLIWMIGRPRLYMIFIQAVLLFIVFTVRYNALYYPIFASFVILFLRVRPWFKVAAILLQFLFIGVFIRYTSTQMEDLTGVRQFSPFGGWKMANNALYMYGHVCQKEDDPVPEKFARLDNMVRKYFKNVRRVDDLSNFSSDGGFYMSDIESPLLQYQFQRYGLDTIFQNFKKWGPMGPICSEYGTYLVRKHPVAFCRWFIWPNTIRYFLTPSEVFSSWTPYFLRSDDMAHGAIKWFGLKTITVSWTYINLRTTLLSPYPLFLGIIHLAFILGLLGVAIFGGFKKLGKTQAYMIVAATCFWICDLFFKVTAGGIVLRHQIFLMIFEFSFALVFIDFIYHSENKTPLTNEKGVISGRL